MQYRIHSMTNSTVATTVTVIGAIREVTADEWNALAGDTNPFIRYEFLSALEKHHCVGDRFGWIPQHIILRDDDGKLIGAVPLYLKDNSYGEFVFDWAWADAYHRSGIHYYPKLVVATPYTPATGPRLLVADQQNNHEISRILAQGLLAHASQLKVSSLHCLFTDPQDTEVLHNTGMMKRMGCQFHWHNQHYENFDEFLASLNSAKRKMIKRERRRVHEASVSLEILDGHTASETDWLTFHRYYESTFMKLGGYATLSLEFFLEIAHSMPDSIVLVMAKHENKPVASAFSIRGKETLYGRHWGCEQAFDSLHFEACYYQGIEYCINNGLNHFEPGAQGEHKISRGFEPTPTWSAHWIAHPQFKQAIGDFLRQENRGMLHYIEQLREHVPYKKTLNTI